MQPLISVVVPVYKVEAYLDQCVKSILCQSYENLEILLVDDGSPDRCGEICDQYARQDPRVTVVHKENGGLSSARNAGIEKARGEYIAFVDSDDWIEPDAYRDMLSLAEKTGASMVCAGRYDFSESTGIRETGLCPRQQEVLTAEEMLKRLFVWNQCDSAAWDKLYRRELFEGIRYPEGKHYEDIPTTYLVIEKAGQVAMLPEPIYNYRHREGSITVAPLSEKTFHFEEHTGPIYAHICREYPGAEKEARFLRVRALRFAVLTGELSPAVAARPFRDRIRSCRRELRRHTWFMLTSPYFEKQERRQDLALAWGIYGPIHRLRHPQ